MFECATFGKVIYKRREYHQDIYVHPSGKVEPRRKELSKLVYGTSHYVVAAEVEVLLEEDPDCIIIGTGYNGSLHLTGEAREFLDEKGVSCKELVTPRAIEEFNSSYNCSILVHVTC
jgi:hypothetical protein